MEEGTKIHAKNYKSKRCADDIDEPSRKLSRVIKRAYTSVQSCGKLKHGNEYDENKYSGKRETVIRQ